ncbi:MAG: hypothetical protein R3362_04645, partial [Rhodothermales bacterium]|nr:hypothetical protein [Rhodothermales bacterium]
RPAARHDRDDAVRRWWSRTDREIERVLDRRQRRVYRDLVHDRYERRGRYDHRGRDGHRGRRPRGHGPGR